MTLHSAPPAIALLYHRVTEAPPDPHGLQISPAHFAAHLEVLAKTTEVVPLATLEPGGSRPRVTITIDDGYVDSLECAKPLLDRFGLPATVFVMSGLAGSRVGFWSDRLANLLLTGPVTCSHLDLEVDGDHWIMHTGSPAARERAYRFLHLRLRRCKPTMIEEAIGLVSRQVGRPPAVQPGSLLLGPEQVRELTTGGGVVVGSHTVNHAMLSSLDEDDQRAEIAGSRNELEALVGEPVDLFSYPFGNHADFNQTSVRLAREIFSRAVTAIPGALQRDSDLHLIPRHYVGDWDELQFQDSLRDWLNVRQ